VSVTTNKILKLAPIQTPFCLAVAEPRKALREQVQRHPDHLDALVLTLTKLEVAEPAIQKAE
jgi:hypothetical protein